MTKEFATPEQMAAAQTDVDAWKTRYPEAADALRDTWKAHLMLVGHKRLGRIILNPKKCSSILQLW
ncbi:MAG: hypothetical protein A2W23_04530 [Planctomycetes bacterium RBG_16_43_13]|nr:MAG: hypothetical protein A2W23_04530 [Planctomycetes bacterium RBG_16_43_13]